MSTGLVMEAGGSETMVSGFGVAAAERDLLGQYDRLMTLLLRAGTWLNSPRAALLSAKEWETQFSRYQEGLQELRRLGDELRPFTLRDRHERLAGEALMDEVMELFAA